MNAERLPRTLGLFSHVGGGSKMDAAARLP